MSIRTVDAGSATGEQPHCNARPIRRTIAIGATAPAIARNALAEVADELPSGLLSHAQLLVSELVSHRVRLTPDLRHGVLDLDISLTRRYLRMQLTDDDRRPDRVLPDPGEPTLGWELQLVAELSDRWGMRHDARTTLWLELDL
jgi:hypothetical protein